MVSRLPIFPVLGLILAFLLTACAGKDRTTPLFVPDEEELMEDYTPRDDGKPLTPDELHAFMTLGEIDRNMSQEESAIVELHFKYFVHERRSTMQRFIDRTARYLPYIHKTFGERGIPRELAAMSMAESGGNPNAISRAGAAGLWQFMPYTGRKYGLNQNRWVDERRDPFKATYAASDYLLKLYGDFKDWHLAMAAYNAGEGKIGRAIERSGSKNFFEICELGDTMDHKTRLRKETTDYVPRIIAMAKIMRNIDRLGFTPPRSTQAYNFTPVIVPPGTNLSSFASALGLSWEEFSGMNPAYRMRTSPPNSESTAYVLPEKTALAVEWLQSDKATSSAGWVNYTIRRGDTLSQLARRSGVSMDEIRAANGFKKLPRAGRSILLPEGAGKVASSGGGAVTSSGQYRVQAGDTLFGLSLKWGTSVKSIQQANSLGNKTSLSLGQLLNIPGGSQTPPSAGGELVTGSTYTIKRGDTLGGISYRTGVSIENICKLNSIDEKCVLSVGQTLKLREGASVAPQQSSGKAASVASKAPQVSSARTYTVKSGETLFSIAQKHKVSVNNLRKANNIGAKSVIRPGQKLRIP